MYVCIYDLLSLCVLFQVAVLFDDTAHYNIHYGNFSATEEQVRTICL